jgi:hypothetical protein
METGWPYLWSLLNADLVTLGWSLPTVKIDQTLVNLTSIAGLGSQGVCYIGTIPGSDEEVLVKVSNDVGIEELESEGRVLQFISPSNDVKHATVVLPEPELKNALLVVNENEDDVRGKTAFIFSELNDALPVEKALSEQMRQCVPRVVASGPRVLITSPVATTFDQSENAFFFFFFSVSGLLQQPNYYVFFWQPIMVSATCTSRSSSIFLPNSPS